MSSVAIPLAFLLMGAIGGVSYYIGQFAQPAANSYYTTNIRFILLYSYGASLLLYGMALYFFAAFPQLGPKYLIFLDGLLILASLTTLYFNTWQTNRTYVMLRNGGDESILAPDSPQFLGYAATLVGVFCILGGLLASFQTMQNRLHLLLLLNILVVPFFFLSSAILNTFAFNNYTNQFQV